MTSTADELYCRVASPRDASSWARVRASALHLLDAAPWAGGRESGATEVLSGAKLLAPTEPRHVLCLANSYAGRQAPPTPFVRWFAKSAGAAAADGGTIRIPSVVDELKAEVEVVMIIGRQVREAGEAEAGAAIFGYTVGLEVFGFPEAFYRIHGESGSQPDVMLAAGLKLGDGFAPFGPFIRRGADWPTAACALTVTNPASGKRIEYRGDTGGLAYSPGRIVSELSRVLTLEAGDVVFTGSKQSLVVGPGDEVIAEIAGLGRLRNRIARGRGETALSVAGS